MRGRLEPVRGPHVVTAEPLTIGTDALGYLRETRVEGLLPDSGSAIIDLLAHRASEDPSVGVNTTERITISS
jgi:hypothetical protein